MMLALQQLKYGMKEEENKDEKKGATESWTCNVALT